MTTPIKTPPHTNMTTESEIGKKSWANQASGAQVDSDTTSQTTKTAVYIILALALLVGGYFIYTNGWPSTTAVPSITKTDLTPSVVVPTPAAPPAALTSVTPSVVAPVEPPAASTATPPATTKTP